MEGIGRFSHEVLLRIVRALPDVDFYFLFDRPFAQEFIYAPNVKPVVLFPPARHPFLFVAYFEICLGLYFRTHKHTLFFSPDGYLCLNAALPQIPVIHDLAFEHFPQFLRYWDKWHYHRFFPRYARKATYILTVSEYSRQDIAQTYQVALDKISVCYNGVSTVFDAPTPIAQPFPYFIYVGSIHPRKNLEQLLRAFEMYKSQTNDNTRLLLIGRKAWNFEQVIAYYQTMRYKADVVFTGYVEDATLAGLYAGAVAVCYVSLLEGFGLPIVEAMRAGAAVICSNRTALPEIAGDAAYLIDPDSPESIANALRHLAKDTTLRESYRNKGKQRSQAFSWGHTANVCAETITRFL